jgi:hypothetical protein
MSPGLHGYNDLKVHEGGMRPQRVDRAKFRLHCKQDYTLGVSLTTQKMLDVTENPCISLYSDRARC